MHKELLRKTTIKKRIASPYVRNKLTEILKHHQMYWEKYSKKSAAQHYAKLNFVIKLLYRQYETTSWTYWCATGVPIQHVGAYQYMYLIIST